ncbi:SIMPL domain-containing protein [Aureitalea marina]|uniref:SIMPL domain-containing protein n=1 Tax=Aureitalea marina TaxID=930804 RepID=A0A2S7KQ85_9FLAO|nr:SIMPL domain-containing protein [Aureitalea marina]PQB04748.1 SIMPL domain-containing protein [Aureitalea marina]
MKTIISTIIFSIAIISGAYLLGSSYVDRSRPEGNISVTGLGETNFSSDLIVWQGSFSVDNMNMQQAYGQLKDHQALIEQYLISKGVSASEIVFNAVSTNRMTRQKYSSSGDYMGEEFSGYRLSQTVQIESGAVERIESISREVTELLNQGVQFYSQAPRYYYTKLADLKIELISKASEDARIRAERMAEQSGSDLGELQTSRMGVFQITGQNADEDYSWGGTFNTSAKHKTASITVKSVFKVD